MPHCGGEAGIDTNCILSSIGVIPEKLYYCFKSTFSFFFFFLSHKIIRCVRCCGTARSSVGLCWRDYGGWASLRRCISLPIDHVHKQIPVHGIYQGIAKNDLKVGLIATGARYC